MTLENTPSPFTEKDDNFHSYDDHPWFTETCWFSFNVPERKMGGWLHGSIRPNLGVCTFQVFVWDDSAVYPWELPYFFVQYAQPLPKERDLRDFTWPHGWSIKILEPLHKYHLTYKNRDLISIDLVFEGLSAPHPYISPSGPFNESAHLDQTGHLTGEISLRGERIPVDCYSVRDRSWGVRMDHRGGRIGYLFGTASERDAFCLFVRPQDLNEDGSEIVNHGYLIKDGIRKQIVEGKRKVVRDAEEGWISNIILDCTDEAGRKLEAEATSVSRMMISDVRGLTINSLLDWRFNGVQGWGEDQDLWRNDQWRSARQIGFNEYRP